MFLLKVKVRGNYWKIGFVEYDTYLDAQIRQEELRLKGITSKIIEKSSIYS